MDEITPHHQSAECSITVNKFNNMDTPHKYRKGFRRDAEMLSEAYSGVYNEGQFWGRDDLAKKGKEEDIARGAVKLVKRTKDGNHVTSTLPKDDPKIEELKKQGYTEIPIEDEELAEGAMGDFATAAGKGIKSIGSGLGRLGAAGAGAVAAGTGAALGGILKVLDTLTAEQLTKIGNYALEKAAEDEEGDVIKGDVPPPPTTDPNDPDYIHPIVP